MELDVEGQGQDGNDPVPVFSATVETVSAVASLLKSVSFCDKLNIFVSQHGLKCTVEEGKYVQASVYIQRGIFSQFSSTSDVGFKIPVKELLDCLKAFFSEGKSNSSSDTFGGGGDRGRGRGQGGDGATGLVFDLDPSSRSVPTATMRLIYEGYGCPLTLLLEEPGVLTDFKLRTEEVDELLDFDLEPIMTKSILNSEPFRELLAEVDGNGPESVKIEVSPRDGIGISGSGSSGGIQVHIPWDCEIVTDFSCSSRVTAHYNPNILKHCFKALGLSQKVALKMDPTGVLCLSFLMPTKIDSFVEFYCMPQVVDEGGCGGS